MEDHQLTLEDVKLSLPDDVLSYCAGASMAYTDCADKMLDMISTSPENIKVYMACLKPIEEALRSKAKYVYIESYNFLFGERQ